MGAVELPQQLTGRDDDDQRHHGQPHRPVAEDPPGRAGGPQGGGEHSAGAQQPQRLQQAQHPQERQYQEDDLPPVPAQKAAAVGGEREPGRELGGEGPHSSHPATARAVAAPLPGSAMRSPTTTSRNSSPRPLITGVRRSSRSCASTSREPASHRSGRRRTTLSHLRCEPAPRGATGPTTSPLHHDTGTPAGPQPQDVRSDPSGLPRPGHPTGSFPGKPRAPAARAAVGRVARTGTGHLLIHQQRTRRDVRAEGVSRHEPPCESWRWRGNAYRRLKSGRVIGAGSAAEAVRRRERANRARQGRDHDGEQAIG